MVVHQGKRDLASTHDGQGVGSFPNQDVQKTPTLGAPFHSSRIPGCSTRSPTAGKLETLSHVLKKETSLNSPEQAPLAKGRGIPRPNFKFGTPKPPRSHEFLPSCHLPSTPPPLHAPAANGLEPRKRSSLSFTLHHSNSSPPPCRQLLLHSMTRKEFQKVPLRKDAVGKGGGLPLPIPLSPSGLQTMRPSIPESSAEADATNPCCEDENHVRDTEIPGSQKNAGPPSPLPSSPSESQPETIPKSPLDVALKETNDKYDSPKEVNTPQGLAGSPKVALFCPQEKLEDHKMVDNLLQADSIVSHPVANTTGVECACILWRHLDKAATSR
ncbi:hypothetical protein JRQ81_016197 [Phrynocephalus forsythii]|uniref:Uncharacterized protein n=1 Tax=Phrynocephalus forsythii TaxID=171643 RepID=A0A9Q0XVD8_9SAUR|nr:hypothetical protein JRQ81_016197 [Phrynocephalus forsythii]